jgi:gamma-polyglutamate synthase
MRDAIDFTSWIAGWTSLLAVIAYGALVISRARRVHQAQIAIPLRILVTGTRGKSGTVRLLHSMFMESGKPAYGKVTGTTAVELFPDGSEKPTTRFGAAGVSEMPEAVIRAAKHQVDVGIFECMAITPSLISLVVKSHVRPHIVVIPSIRLDHLEEEGLDERAIATSIIESVGPCEYVVAGSTQPDVVEVFEKYCGENNITLVTAAPDETTPVAAGHHPTNVAVAIAVATIAGLSPDEATRHLASSSVEPRALTMMSVEVDGGVLNCIDLGGANDPQSAWEALAACCVDEKVVVPLLVNRWERPLRSVLFAGSVLGRFPLILTTGTLAKWSQSLHDGHLAHHRRDHDRSEIIRLSRANAKDPTKLYRDLVSRMPGQNNQEIFLIILQNTHESTADVLRKSLERDGVNVPLVSRQVKS